MSGQRLDRGSSSDDASRASGDASWAVLWLPDALRGRRAAVRTAAALWSPRGMSSRWRAACRSRVRGGRGAAGAPRSAARPWRPAWEPRWCGPGRDARRSTRCGSGRLSRIKVGACQQMSPAPRVAPRSRGADVVSGQRLMCDECRARSRRRPVQRPAADPPAETSGAAGISLPSAPATGRSGTSTPPPDPFGAHPDRCRPTTPLPRSLGGSAPQTPQDVKLARDGSALHPERTVALRTAMIASRRDIRRDRSRKGQR